MHVQDTGERLDDDLSPRDNALIVMTGEATGLLLSNLPKSTLPSDIKRFLHTHGSRSQHLSQSVCPLPCRSSPLSLPRLTSYKHNSHASVGRPTQLHWLSARHIPITRRLRLCPCLSPISLSSDTRTHLPATQNRRWTSTQV